MPLASVETYSRMCSAAIFPVEHFPPPPLVYTQFTKLLDYPKTKLYERRRPHTYKQLSQSPFLIFSSKVCVAF
jgi:hypothetical protein